MSNLKIIDQRDVLGKEFRIYGDYENPLFLAKDVAEWIDYAKTGRGCYDVSGMVRTIDDTEISTINNRTYLTEDGLYEVLMQSRKPIAKQFKSKVKEILKDIRVHGIYARTEILNSMLSDPDTMISILMNYRDERECRLKAEKQVDEQQSLVEFTKKS